MWDRVSFKATAKANFKASYWPFIAVSVLYTLLFSDLASVSIDVSAEVEELIYLTQVYGIETGQDALYMLQYTINLLAPYAISSTILGYAIALLVAKPYEVGASRFYLENTTFHFAPFSRVAMGFKANFGNVVLTQFLRNLFIFLWSLLFIIPGIVRSYGYFAVPFILAENPNMDHRRVLDLSRQMTRGYKGEIFVTDLSFLGWHLLSVFTFGILSIFYVNPYYYATRAEIYRFIRSKAMEQGITSPHELPGMGTL